MQRVRIDKWLWAARFFKSRAKAQKELSLGRVLVNGERVKSSRLVEPDDRLHIKAAHGTFDVRVCAVSETRRSAKEAVLLYEESEESKEARLVAAQARSLAPGPIVHSQKGRPTKKKRRDINKILGK